MRAPARSIVAALVVAVLSVAACSSADTDEGGAAPAGSDRDAAGDDSAGDDTATDEPADDSAGGRGSEAARGERSETYSDPASWLCSPDVSDDPCDGDLDATLVNADGTTEVEPFEAAPDPAADCFYVYPTISEDPGDNSDLVPGDPEIGIAANQAARFAEQCTVYAPMYRQVPLGALVNRLSGASGDQGGTAGEPTPRDIAYGDVREAFMHYLAEYNQGRPFVLIGHSQGAGQLSRLLAEEIDPDEALRADLVSALLIGAAVPDGGDGSFENIPACATAEESGCVVSYASFYAAEPPPPDSFFGRAFGEGGARALCTNPADPTNPGPVPLQTYLSSDSLTGAVQVDTPFVHYDGLLTGQCRSEGEFDWLELTNTSAGAQAWPSDLGGRLTPQWGTHLMDVNFALGDLVDLVGTQVASR